MMPVRTFIIFLFQALHQVPCPLKSSQQLQAAGTSVIPILQMGQGRLQDINLPKVAQWKSGRVRIRTQTMLTLKPVL